MSDEMDELSALIILGVLRTRLNRELEVKLTDEQFETLMHFRRALKRTYGREPSITEYKMVLEMTNVKNEVRTRMKKIPRNTYSKQERILRIIKKRYGVPSELMDALQYELDWENRW